MLGKSPLTYVRDLRVEQATHLLATTEHTIDEIARRVGYQDGVRRLRARTSSGVGSRSETLMLGAACKLSKRSGSLRIVRGVHHDHRVGHHRKQERNEAQIKPAKAPMTKT